MSRKAMCAVPPMGWNSWNTFTENINEELIRETVDSMKEQGFLERLEQEREFYSGFDYDSIYK